MPHRMTRRAFAASVASLAVTGTDLAFGDDCSGQSTDVDDEPGTKHVVLLSYDASKKTWKGQFHDKGKTKRFTLPLLREHAHLFVVVPKAVKRFGIVDFNAGHHHDRRVQIYAHDGKLVRAFDLGDMLTAKEIDRANKSMSISHMRWAESRTRVGGDIGLTAPGGRGFRISVAKAKVI
jgi:hypothetical protein